MYSKLDAVTPRVNGAEEEGSDIEDEWRERKVAEAKREKQLMDYERMLWEISDTMKQNNIRIIGIPEERERKREGHKVYLNKS